MTFETGVVLSGIVIGNAKTAGLALRMIVPTKKFFQDFRIFLKEFNKDYSNNTA